MDSTSDKEHPHEVVSGGRAGRSRGRRFLSWLPVLLLFGTYPLALVMPVHAGVPLVFHLTLPTSLWLALATLTFLVLTPLRAMGDGAAASRRRHVSWARNALLVLCGLCLWTVAWHRAARFEDMLLAWGVFSATAYFGLCPRSFLPPRLPLVLSLLWLVQAGHGFWQDHVFFEVVGLAGNRNWLAALIAALLPWPFLLLWRCGRDCRRRGQAWLGLVSTMGAGISLLVSCRLLYKADSRGTWLVLGVYAVLFWVLPRFRPWMRALILLVLALAAADLAALESGRLRQALAEDIRLPLWRQTVCLIADHAWLGVGPGGFRREFTRYRAVEQLASPNAAPVTEHPHNEFLQVASALGLPVAVAWVLLFLPLLWRPTPTPFWRAVHFGAWMLVGTACFDKQLVQPPTCLLAPLLVGLLWRRRLRARVDPGGRGRLRRWLVLPVAVAAGLVAAGVGVREVRLGWLFRRAYIRELAGDLRGAYDCYRHAAYVAPTNVQAQALAGICANNKLRSPQLALPHLLAAARLEPDFAHLNGEIGSALGALGRHGQALAYLRRETRLFPFDVLAHERLFACCLATGHVAQARLVETRLASLCYRQLVLRRGHDWTAGAALRWARAVARGQTAEAVAAAAELTNAFPTTMAEPAFFDLCLAAGVVIDAAARARITDQEAAQWQQLWRWRRLARGQTKERPGPRVDRCWARFREVGAGSASAGSGPGTGTPAGAARGLAECLRQAGIEAALAQGAGGRELGVVEIRAGRDVWLAAPGAGVIFRGVGLASLQDAPELQARFGVSPEDAAALRLALPVSAADFFSRTRVLGYVLREALGAAAPCLGESPTLRLEFWRTQQCLALPPQPGAGGRSAEAGQARLPVVLEVAGLSPVPQL